MEIPNDITYKIFIKVHKGSTNAFHSHPLMTIDMQHLLTIEKFLLFGNNMKIVAIIITKLKEYSLDI